MFSIMLLHYRAISNGNFIGYIVSKKDFLIFPEITWKKRNILIFWRLLKTLVNLWKNDECSNHFSLLIYVNQCKFISAIKEVKNYTYVLFVIIKLFEK